MSDHTVTVRHTGGLSFSVDNGRTTVATEWNPGADTWLATELFLGGLGSCMLATLTAYARANGIDVTGAGVTVVAESTTRPARMSRINITYLLPERLSDTQVDALVRAGDKCKIHNTIHGHPEFVTRAVTMKAESVGSHPE